MRCNLSCPECYVSEYINMPNRKDEIDLSLAKIEELAQNLDFEGVYLTGGEPLAHPEIYDVINYFYLNNKKIYIATNALLLTDNMIEFISDKNIDLLISVRDEYREIFSVVNKLTSRGIKVSCYHLPDEASPELLYDFIKECPHVDDYKLLYNSKNPPDSKKWFSMLEEIYFKIKDSAKNKNIIVELGFLPANHALVKEEKRGGFDRIQINTEGEIYSCPLLAEKRGVNICSKETCPVLSKDMDDDLFKSVCCFLVTSLETSLKLWVYGRSRYEKKI